MSDEPSKLSDSQLAVLHNMIDGWELGVYGGERITLQKGGLGKGGETHRVHGSTFESLYVRGLIRRLRGYMPSHYRLTPKGRKAAKAAS